MPFTFKLNAHRAFRCTDGATAVLGSDVNDRVAMALDTEGDIPSAIGHLMPELLRKWGLSGMHLKSFRFDAAHDEGGASPVFHQGMSHELANDFFNDPEVLRTLTIPSSSGRGAVSMGEGIVKLGGGNVRAAVESLDCTLTNLSFLNRVLHCKSIVRNPPSMPRVDETSSTDVNKVFRYPIIRQMDIFMPCGVTVSDALREYMMLPDDTYSENRVRVLDEELDANGTAPEADDDLTDDREYPLISSAQRKQFLFHVFWRLVSGGGPLCQFEEDAIYYKMGARELYKDIVCVGRRKAVDGNARPELLIQSHVLAVHSVRVGEGKRELNIFPVSDEISPSNGNFAYLIISPSRREVVWWYNAFSSY